MKDAQPMVKTPAEGASDALDESTREMLNDYTQKLVKFIQHEKERVKKQAVEDAERVVAEAERKGRQAYEKALRDARTESEVLLAQTRGAVKELVDEADRFAQAIADLRQKAEKDISEISERLSKEAEAVAEAVRRGEQAVGEARAQLQAGFESSSAVVVSLKERIQQGARALARESAAEPPPPAAPPLPAARTDGETAPPRPREGAGRRHAERTFTGAVHIELYNGNPMLYRRFRETLAKTPNLEISQIEDAIGDRMKMVVSLSQPLPLLNIISLMTFVRSAVADEDRLKVVLQQTDRWMG